MSTCGKDKHFKESTAGRHFSPNTLPLMIIIPRPFTRSVKFRPRLRNINQIS